MTRQTPNNKIAENRLAQIKPSAARLKATNDNAREMAIRMTKDCLQSSEFMEENNKRNAVISKSAFMPLSSLRYREI